MTTRFDMWNGGVPKTLFGKAEGAVVAVLLAVAGALVLAPLVFSPVSRSAVEPIVAEALDPSVRVETPGGSGSGTVIRSDEFGTYVLTNNHVVADGAPKIHFWNPDGSETSFAAKVVATSKPDDLTLLYVRGLRAGFVTHFAAPGDKLHPGEDVWVVGCPLGARTQITKGIVGVPDEKFEEHRAVAMSAPTIYGNSGGTLLVKRDGHFVMAGVPEAIALAPMGIGMRAPLSTMAFAIPMSDVRAFLQDSGFGMLSQ